VKTLFTKEEEGEGVDDDEGAMQIEMETGIESGIMDSASDGGETSVSVSLEVDDDPLSLLQLYVPGAIFGGVAEKEAPPPQSPREEDDEDKAADQLAMFSMLCKESAEVLFAHDFNADVN